MKTFLSDIIPQIQRFSQKLDNLTLLTNQHWVAIDNINSNKTVYIFRSNNDLLISNNGKVEKAKWEYLGNNSLLIDRKDESLLFRHGFFDENVLALKIDGKDEYAFLVNENKSLNEINSIEKVLDFLKYKYLNSLNNKLISNIAGVEIRKEKNSIMKVEYQTNKGKIWVVHPPNLHPCEGDLCYFREQPAPDGKYEFGFMWYVHVKNGKVQKVTLF